MKTLKSVLNTANVIVFLSLGQIIPANSSEGNSSEINQMINVEGGSLPSTSKVHNRNIEEFRIGKYEVTRKEWNTVQRWAIKNGYDIKPSTNQLDNQSNPVTDVSWYEVMKWCNAKSEMEALTPVYTASNKVYKTGIIEKEGPDGVVLNNQANGYRLPTDEEWEYAARGGNKSKGYMFSGSDDLNAVGWYKLNSSNTTLTSKQINENPKEGKALAQLDLEYYSIKSVGQKQPNELGIYDMSGNASEWTWGATSNVRGGCSRDPQKWNRVDLRYRINLDYEDCYVGFRLAQNMR